MSVLECSAPCGGKEKKQQKDECFLSLGYREILTAIGIFKNDIILSRESDDGYTTPQLY